MRKRIALFIISFMLLLGAFFLYQVLTGASFLSPHKPVVINDEKLEDHPPRTNSAPQRRSALPPGAPKKPRAQR